MFTLHRVDATGRAVLRRNLRRRELLAFFERLPPVEVVLEACGVSHHWGRALVAIGHRVRLIPPQYVKPSVKRSKNDRNDAEAISVAAAQLSIGSVPVKSIEQQAAAMLLSVRELLVRQRTQKPPPGTMIWACGWETGRFPCPNRRRGALHSAHAPDRNR